MRHQSSAQKPRQRLWCVSTLWNLPWFLSVLEEQTSEQILTGLAEKREPNKPPQPWEQMRSAASAPASSGGGGERGAGCAKAA